MSNINDFMIKEGYLWKYNGNDTNIEIPDGVTSIASDAFADCDDITRLIIPDSVSSLGFNTFKRFNIEYLFIGSGLSSTNNDFNKESLNSVVFSKNREEIGYAEFSDCAKLTNVLIPKCIKKIGTAAFTGCSGLESIEVEEGNPVYHSADNCLIETESKTLLVGCKNSIIPDDGSVTDIAYAAFRNCEGLKSITIPDCITKIGDSAFCGCTGLKSITIPQSVLEIGGSAFGSCNAEITYHVGNDFAKVPPCAFQDFEGTIKVIIEDGVSSIGNSAFWRCSNIIEVVIPNSVTNIDLLAFEGCSGIKNIVISKNVTSINGKAFSNCSSLESITVEEGNPVYHSANNCLIETESKKLLSGCNTSVIPDDGSVEIICSGAFSGRTGLKCIVIPDSVVEIGGSAFSGCKNLEKVTLSENIKKIESYTFACCEKLAEISIPDAITEIDYGAFGDCFALSKIKIGTGLQTVSRSGGITAGCESISCIEVSDKNEHFCSIDNCLVDIDEKELLFVGSDGKIPENEIITKIAKYAFSGRKDLKAIVIPSNITEIGIGAFADCENLESVDIPESVTKIGTQAFINCKRLGTLLIPSTVKEIGNDIFMHAKVTIVCKDKSFAQKYAKKNKIKFEII